MLLTLLAFALALGLLVTFHELGHYWVARACGVRVLRFSVGFGRILWSRRNRHGTEWAFSAIPLGGYVKMLDEPAPGAGPAEHAAAFVLKPRWQRSLIVLAGPVANLLLAALLYAGLHLMGSVEPAAVIAPPPVDSAAADAGLLGGETLVAVQGEAVDSWPQLRWRWMDAGTPGAVLSVSVADAHGRMRDYLIQVPAVVQPDAQSDGLEAAGLVLAPARPRVTRVMAGGAGEQAGLEAGDIIVSIGGQTDPDPRAVIDAVLAAPDIALPVEVLRDGTVVSLQLRPHAEISEHGALQGRIAVMLGADRPMVTVRYGLFESLWRGVRRTVETASLTVRMMGRMVLGEASWQNVSGPVTIADVAGQSARAGLASYIHFLALISVSIGVLNLLPIPMLDGGHLLFLLIEAIRQRPLPPEWLDTGQRFGLVLLAGLMGLAFFNDFMRLFS